MFFEDGLAWLLARARGERRREKERRSGTARDSKQPPTPEATTLDRERDKKEPGQSRRTVSRKSVSLPPGLGCMSARPSRITSIHLCSCFLPLPSSIASPSSPSRLLFPPLPFNWPEDSSFFLSLEHHLSFALAWSLHSVICLATHPPLRNPFFITMEYEDVLTNQPVVIDNVSSLLWPVVPSPSIAFSRVSDVRRRVTCATHSE